MTDQAEPLVRSTNHTSFTVSDEDFDRFLRFFGDGLGFDLSPTEPRDAAGMEKVTGVPGADVLIAYVSAPGHKIELINYLVPADRKVVDVRPCDTGFPHIAFDVTDIDRAVGVADRFGFAAVHEPLPVSDGPNKGYLCVYTRDRATGITIEYIGPRVG